MSLTRGWRKRGSGGDARFSVYKACRVLLRDRLDRVCLRLRKAEILATPLAPGGAEQCQDHVETVESPSGGSGHPSPLLPPHKCVVRPKAHDDRTN